MSAGRGSRTRRRPTPGPRVAVTLIDEQDAPPPDRRSRFVVIDRRSRFVVIDRRSRFVVIDRRRLRRLVRSALAGRDLGGAREVTVVITGDARIRDLCARFLGRPRRTDVLAFPGGEPAGEEASLGEVVVNAECALREARRRGHDVQAELLLYVAHGLLHLVGYDDQTQGERQRMRAEERAVLSRFRCEAVVPREAQAATRSATEAQRHREEIHPRNNTKGHEKGTRVR